MADVPTTNLSSNFSFHLSYPASDASPFGPRLGRASLKRNDDSPAVEIDTPGLLTTTSRGVIPHLSRDHHRFTEAIRWVLIPFETFLERIPPVPTLQGGSTSLHKFLGYSPLQNTVIMSARDPFDGRELPPNGNDHISSYSMRGVRKVTPSAWRSYVFACRPDIVIALSDIPFTKLPHSQKRLTKSLERSTSWLSNLLRPTELDDDSSSNPHPLNVLVHMVGGTNIAARRIFSEGILETLRDNEAEAIKPLKRLDDGVTGYVFDLVPLRLSLAAELDSTNTSPDILDTTTAPQMSVDTSALVPLMKASLNPLPTQKLRLVNSAISPHEILRLIRDVGIDVFDAHWAQRAADIGVALDFRFPVVDTRPNNRTHQTKRELGHNLYDQVYAHDFTRLADCFLDGASSLEQDSPYNSPICPCAACSPLPPPQHISHSSIDSESYPESVHAAGQFLPPFRRAYLHHLLHTHEMSSHSLLVMHNLSVFDAFLSGVRTVLAHPNGTAVFTTEVDKFVEEYDEEMKVFEDAKKSWAEVERARGKGRLAREKDKQAESTLGTAVEL